MTKLNIVNDIVRLPWKDLSEKQKNSVIIDYEKAVGRFTPEVDDRFTNAIINGKPRLCAFTKSGKFLGFSETE